jgi:hypothetical protein
VNTIICVDDDDSQRDYADAQCTSSEHKYLQNLSSDEGVEMPERTSGMVIDGCSICLLLIIAAESTVLLNQSHVHRVLVT